MDFMRDAYNCTNVELKQAQLTYTLTRAVTYNCTNVELKRTLMTLVLSMLGVGLIIAPTWN